MIFFKGFLRKLGLFNSEQKRIEYALALHRRGEARPDGLTLIRAFHHLPSEHLEIEWRARDIHPWDRGCGSAKYDRLFTEQALADTDAALSRLFKEFPGIGAIEFRVIHPGSDVRILASKVERSTLLPRTQNASARTRLWHRGVTTIPLP